MGLIEITEPFLSYICTLKKLSNSGDVLDASKIRTDLNNLISQMQEQSQESQALESQFNKVKLPLIFFADYIVYESGFKLSEPWKPMASEFDEYAGEEKFFVILEEELKDNSSEATERLSVYYSCLGLGMKNAYLGSEEELSQIMRQMFKRLFEKYKVDKSSKITPEAYKNVDKRDFTEQLAPKAGGLGVVFLSLLIIWFVSCLCLYHDASNDIEDSAETINSINSEDIYSLD
ncbi:DotU family type IV/VI secretion system protein [Sedimentisphaera salicampi]|uniref:Type IV/VI secretion system protein, DotU family n=1 Tax=Sedimentisphaera salicampi TaxID=1941349 RepID=A0A1W6LMC4_9BACT|nr:DotU family type IV/VI secretion system protein [Sedimentisphaera salicampi]ARN56925.1 type IV/VI secretion system protein, DotU family [Sedimentisphaera salicampi]